MKTRAKIYFDNVDYEILYFCKDYLAGVMEMVDNLKIKHISLKKHIYRLISNKFLDVTFGKSLCDGNKPKELGRERNFLSTSKKGKLLLELFKDYTEKENDLRKNHSSIAAAKNKHKEVKQWKSNQAKKVEKVLLNDHT